jgi:hypothetical protein
MGEASNDIRYRVLENWCLAHTGEKSSLEQATENLTQILNDHVIKKKMFFFC